MSRNGIEPAYRLKAAMYRSVLQDLAYVERNLTDAVKFAKEAGLTTEFFDAVVQTKAGISDMFRELTLAAAGAEPEAFSQKPYPRAEEENESGNRA